MMTIAVDDHAFHTALARIDGAVDRLGGARHRVGRELDDLLGSDWVGVAAEAFAEGWDVWWRGSQQVLHGLAELRRLVEAVQRDLDARDDEAQARVDAIAARLGTAAGR